MEWYRCCLSTQVVWGAGAAQLEPSLTKLGSSPLESIYRYPWLWLVGSNDNSCMDRQVFKTRRVRRNSRLAQNASTRVIELTRDRTGACNLTFSGMRAWSIFILSMVCFTLSWIQARRFYMNLLVWGLHLLRTETTQMTRKKQAQNSHAKSLVSQKNYCYIKKLRISSDQNSPRSE